MPILKNNKKFRHQVLSIQLKKLQKNSRVNLKKTEGKKQGGEGQLTASILK